MTSFLETFLPLVVYVLLIVLLIVAIILGIRAIQTLNKIDRVVDDVNDKVQSLNAFFNVINFTTDKITGLTDKMVDFVTGIFEKVFAKKDEDREEID